MPEARSSYSGFQMKNPTGCYRNGVNVYISYPDVTF